MDKRGVIIKEQAKNFLLESLKDPAVKLAVIWNERLLIFIIKGFRTLVFIFIDIPATFRLTCPPAFFRSL